MAGAAVCHALARGVGITLVTEVIRRRKQPPAGWQSGCILSSRDTSWGPTNERQRLTFPAGPQVAKRACVYSAESRRHNRGLFRAMGGFRQDRGGTQQVSSLREADLPRAHNRLRLRAGKKDGAVRTAFCRRGKTVSAVDQKQRARQRLNGHIGAAAEKVFELNESSFRRPNVR